MEGISLLCGRALGANGEMDSLAADEAHFMTWLNGREASGGEQQAALAVQRSAHFCADLRTAPGTSQEFLSTLQEEEEGGDGDGRVSEGEGIGGGAADTGAAPAAAQNGARPAHARRLHA